VISHTVNMAAQAGIIRTASGRQTYAADGLVEGSTNEIQHDLSNRSRSEATSSDTSGTLTGESPQKNDGTGYLTEEGKEAVEEPILVQPTGRSRGQYFEPLGDNDRQTLTRLATRLSRTQSAYTGRNSAANDNGDLERTDTLAGLEMGESDVLDPSSPKFDLHKYFLHPQDGFGTELIFLVDGYVL
jgi:hypothetical protein